LEAAFARRFGGLKEPMIIKTVRRGDHIWTVETNSAPASGWHIIEQRGTEIVRQRACGDWHRVERALRLLQTSADLQRPDRTEGQRRPPSL
jgi:hypothetical protein